MSNTKPEADRVDPDLAYEGFASLKNHDGNPVNAVRHAYNNAVQAVTAAGRQAVMVRVLIHVSPQVLAFDDTPLTGGVCDMTTGCESCQ